MKLKDIMTREVEIVHPDDSLQTAAQKMRYRDVGFLPVCDGERLIGVLTDRDIALRATANGVDPRTSLSRDWFTTPVVYCFDDQDVDEAAQLMREHQIRRLVILGRHDKRLVGVVSLGDLATNVEERQSGKVLQEVSEPA